MSAFCFSIFSGMSVFRIAFLLPNLLITFKISSTLTFEKLKLCGLNAFLIAYKLGWLRNFFIAFKAGWEMHSAEKLISLNSAIFKCFTTLEKKKRISILASSSLLVIILSSCANVIFSDSTYLKNEVLLFSRTSYHLSYLFRLNFCKNLF